MIYRFIHTKRATARYAQTASEIEKGRATRKGMDGEMGVQTQSLQERAGENRRKSAIRGRNGKGKNRISRARVIPSKKVTGRERGNREG